MRRSSESRERSSGPVAWRSRLAGLLLALVAGGGSGCALAARAWGAPAAGAWAGEQPATAYDKPGVTHDEQCVGAAGGSRVIVRDADGAQLRTLAGPVSEPPEARETCAGAPGVRLEGIESLRADGLTLYYSWPLEGGEQAPGFVAAGELAGAPRLEPQAAAGNGSPAPPAPGEPAYRVRPEDIASEQRYGGPSTGGWYTYSVYGRPLGGAAFALLSWSWIDVAGGGIARAAVSAGTLFHPANVQPLTLSSAAGPGLPANGTVTARYGWVSGGGERLYGWMVTSHTFDGACYDHMTYAGVGAPLAGTLCPEGELADSIGDGPGLGDAPFESASGTPAAA
jgi:hypothetical protein